MNPKPSANIFRFVTNLNEVEVERFDWGQLSWLDSATLTGSETLTVGLCYIYPGKGNPEHHHPNCDEALFLLQGELMHTIEDEEYHLSAGDLLHIPQGARHRAECIGVEPARIVVMYNTGRRQVIGEFD